MSDPTNGCDVPPPNKAISLDLTRALGEAVDGFAGNGDVFLVASYQPVHTRGRGGFEVWGPYKSWADVSEDVQNRVCAGKAGFFGPFTTPDIIDVRGRRVTGFDLHVKGEGRVRHGSTRRLDALFFGQRAVEKFALPYYERLFGPQYAVHVMRQFLKADVQVMAHYPWSEYTTGGGGLAVAPSLVVERGGEMTFVPITGAEDDSEAHGGHGP